MAATVIRVGETSRAAELYEILLPEVDRWHVMGFGGFAVEATYARYLGGLAALLGRHAEAERHFEAALAHAEAAGARPECARVLAAHGAMLVGRNDTRARELFARARPIAEELGLARVLAAIPTTTSAPAPPRPAARAPTLVQDGETWLFAIG